MSDNNTTPATLIPGWGCPNAETHPEAYVALCVANGVANDYA